MLLVFFKKNIGNTSAILLVFEILNKNNPNQAKNQPKSLKTG
jgi:hypothetical protein